MVEETSFVDNVVTQLRAEIVHGLLSPSQELALRPIALQCGVSFIPVREALRILETERLLVCRPGRSGIVAPLELAEVAGLYRMRTWIETDLNARSCVLIAPCELDRLEQAIPTLGPANGRPGDDYRAYLDWYADLLGPALTPAAHRTLRPLWLASMRYRYASYARMTDEDVARARADTFLFSLLRAYRGKDPEQVGAVVSASLDRSRTIAQWQPSGLPTR